MTNFNNMYTWLEQDEFNSSMDSTQLPDPALDPVAPDEPESPDMDGIDDQQDDFNVWRTNYFDAAIKADTNEMLDLISQIRNRKLRAPEHRFVEDNLQVLLLRQDPNIEKASKEIRKLIKEELDLNHPATSLMQHMSNVLVAYPVINEIFIKLSGLLGLKGELHRRLIAALLGAVQTGGGSEKQDLIYCAEDYTIDISTRFYTQFGDINLGVWSLQEDDASQYLSEPEINRLQNGSPEEKRVLRRRICIDSISDKYGKRAYLIHVFEPDTGIMHALGFDIAEALKAGYREGRLVVRKSQSRTRDAMIDDNGDIISIFAYAINYRKDAGDLMSDGSPNQQEVRFMEQRNGVLFLTGDQDIVQEVVSGSPGMFYDARPYDGNPSDLPTIMRCVPSTVELLMRRCQ